MSFTARRTTTVLALALGFSACATTQPQTTGEAFETYAQAMGTHDLETMMSLYTEDAQWTVDDRVVATGRESLRTSHGYELGIGSQRTFDGWEVEGDRVVVRTTESNEFFQVFGVENVEGVTVFEFENGRIRSIQTNRDLETLDAVAPQMGEFFGWLMRTDETFCQGLFEGGTFDGDGAEGMQLIQYACQWQELVQGRGFETTQSQRNETPTEG